MATKAPRTVVDTAYFEGTKEVQAILYSDGTILVNKVRLSFPHFGKTYDSVDDNGNKKSKYSVKGMMPKSTHKPAMRLMKKHMDQMMKDNKTDMLASDRKYLRNGDDLGKQEMIDHFVFSASEDSQPSIRNQAAVKITDPNIIDKMFYGGCWGNLLIRPWWQNHQKYGKRVNSGIVAAQFVKDDEPFGEGRIGEDVVDDTFQAVEGAASGFDDDADLDDL